MIAPVRSGAGRMGKEWPAYGSIVCFYCEGPDLWFADLSASSAIPAVSRLVRYLRYGDKAFIGLVFGERVGRRIRSCLNSELCRRFY